jgi:hypothetical protein
MGTTRRWIGYCSRALTNTYSDLDPELVSSSYCLVLLLIYSSVLFLSLSCVFDIWRSHCLPVSRVRITVIETKHRMSYFLPLLHAKKLLHIPFVFALSDHKDTNKYSASRAGNI